MIKETNTRMRELLSGSTNNIIFVLATVLASAGTGLGVRFVGEDAIKLWTVEYIREHVPPPEVRTRLTDCENEVDNLSGQYNQLQSTVNEIQRLDLSVHEELENVKAKLWEIEYIIKQYIKDAGSN